LLACKPQGKHWAENNAHNLDVGMLLSRQTPACERPLAFAFKARYPARILSACPPSTHER